MDAAVNPARGEVALVIDGRKRVLRLTLGALAALEARLEADSLLALAERFDEGRVNSAELISLLAAGLAGAGEPIDEEGLAQASIDGGVVAALHVGVKLLEQAFQPFQADPRDG